MKRKHIRAVLVTLTAILAGCSSANVEYYTLSAPSRLGSSDAAPLWNHPYQLTILSVPAQVDDTPIVVRQTNDQLMVLMFDRWTSPVREQMYEGLARELGLQLGMPPLQNLVPQTSSKVAQVRVQVQGFDLEPAKAATMDAVWRVTPAGGKANTLVCHSVLRSDSAPGVAPLVQAQQRNVTQLAKQIAQVLRTERAPENARCLSMP